VKIRVFRGSKNDFAKEESREALNQLTACHARVA
jgi:hypothetical protein